MKVISVFLLLSILVSCSSSGESDKSTPGNKDEQVEYKKEYDLKGELCWKGTINHKIPVFVHFSNHDGVLIGEIVYLKTQVKKPIRIVGEIEEERVYRLVEYDKKGKVTGVMEATIWGKGNKFTGNWTNLMDAPMDLDLDRIDTNLTVASVEAEDIYANYVYSYGEEMQSGQLAIEKISDTTMAFEINTRGMGADPVTLHLDKDTVPLNASGFTYAIPELPNCIFEVKFFKGFTCIRYKEQCDEHYKTSVGVAGVYFKEKE